jgi:hypothetical protein
VSGLTANVCLITKIIAALHWACLPSAQRTRTSPANVLGVISSDVWMWPILLQKSFEVTREQ